MIYLEHLVTFQAARWLKANNYTWETEFRLPNRQRIDVLATHQRTGRKLIVECKTSSHNGKWSIRRHIKQLQNYHQQLGEPTAELMLAMPPRAIYTKTFELCKANGVVLLVVPQHADTVNEREFQWLVKRAERGEPIAHIAGSWLTLDEAITLLNDMKAMVAK